MIMKKLTTTAAVVIAIATLVTSSHALTASQVKDIKNTVLGVPVPEMPAKAVELVIKAEKKDRQAVAVTAVRAIVMKHRAAAPVVIAAISKAVPEVAPVIAVAAAEIANDQAPAIARAAAVAAPAQAPQISSAISSAVPAQSVAVARVVPSVGTRGAAAQQPVTGDVRIEDTRIDGSEFPDEEPTPAPEPQIIYNQPPN